MDPEEAVWRGIDWSVSGIVLLVDSSEYDKKFLVPQRADFA